MPTSVKTRALILRSTKYGEADLILQALTVGGEKISLLARGALKSKRRFSGGVLEPTHFVELQFKRPLQENKIATLEGAHLVNGFDKIRNDYDRVEAAFFVIETLSKASQEGDVHSEGLFNLGGHSLRTLEKAKSLKTFRLHFCLKLLFQQGVLEPESWMNPYLGTSMADHEKIEGLEDPQKDLHLSWAENKLREYLSTGMLTS
ncbi:MAG: DNA repair protein RecO [Pseudobdellovibrionaceae bacterium]